MQISHTSATKLEAILMVALDYLDDKQQLEKQFHEEHPEDEALPPKGGEAP